MKFKLLRRENSRAEKSAFYGVTVSVVLATIADRLNLDRCYLSTAFKKKYGISPMQYLMNLRLETAAELMVTHGKPPSLAAMSVGYPDIYNFSKMFKKKFGYSPRQYIQNAKNNAES